ncbi:MAG: sigma-54-dependent Fis family transcriptional regulator [Deltaproteobacteria bacterium]|nr:sigma-54-dependent Fis family transcriptional regulator [Deltaproteobacteria bacterium]
MDKQLAKILVVDDDEHVLNAVTAILRRDGHEVLPLGDPVEAVSVARDASIDVVVSDIMMPHLTGIDLLKAFKQAQPEVEVIMMTAHATVETALESVRAGAYDYLTKPFARIEDLRLAVGRAVDRRALRRRANVLESALSTNSRFEGITGQSPAMRAIFKLVETVSNSTATVLIQGESGTGKELVAQAVHFRSPRRNKPFITVNCSALSETLLESELFGHVKGSFTGALANKKGLFEAAHGGTIFLDEIGDVSPATQVRLLRVLQEGEVRPVGSNEPVHVDVRVVSATNVDLRKAMEQDKFREDLFYRLNVINLVLPPLRQRPDDVPLLAHHFVMVYSEKSAKKVTGITSEAMESLTRYGWPGNVRELENVIERAVVLCSSPQIGVDDLPPEVRNATRPGAEADISSLVHLPFAQAKALSVAAFERRYLNTIMERSGQNVSQAAAAAGMDRSNFRRLLKDHGIGGRATKDGEGEG